MIGILILGLFIVFAIIGIFTGWREVAVRGLTALLIVAAFEIAAAISSYHTEGRITSFYVVKKAINAAWISAVAVDIVMLYLFGMYNLFGEYYNSLSGIICRMFLTMVVFAIGSVIKMIFMTILAATTPKSEGQET